MAKSTNQQPKGLSDEDLIKKYEAGKFNLKKAVSLMLKPKTSPVKPKINKLSR